MSLDNAFALIEGHPESSHCFKDAPAAAKKMREKLEYIHNNPIRRKLVTHQRDWPWSSWSFYTLREQGLLKIGLMGGSQTSIEKNEEKNSPPFQKPKG